MDYDVRLAIHLILPEAQYGGCFENNTEEEFNALRWEDSRPKPAWGDVVAAHEKLVPAFIIKQKLAHLDGIYPRVDEDRDTAMGFTPFANSAQAKAKAEKDALRAQLMALSV